MSELVRAMWAGVQGLTDLAPVGRFAAQDPATFRAEWCGVEVDGVQLAEWRCTPATGALRPEAVRALRFDVILSGRARYRIGTLDQTAESGAVLLFQTDQPFLFLTQGDVRVGQVRIQLDRLPAWLQDSASAPGGVLPATPSTAGYAALVERLIEAIRTRGEAPRPETANAVAVLAVALLEEALHPANGAGDLRAQMVTYIQRNISDPDLGPRRLATEFGVSLRWVHRTFNDVDLPVARYIRQRRVEAVAAHLRSTRSPARVTDLALRFGFAGRDQLARSFRDCYGTTISGYVAAHRTPAA